MEKGWKGFIMADVLEKDLSTQAKMLYCALCIFADKKTGECYPTRETLMHYTSIGNERTFAKGIRELEKNGIIEIRERRKERGSAFGGRVYRIIPGYKED